MGSDTGAMVRIGAGALLLAVAGFGAGANAASARGLVACLLLGAGAAALLARGVAGARRAPAALELPVGVPHDQAALTARVLALEAQLEYAPIALFRVGASGPGDAVEPVNASARRLLAPGRASDAGQVRRVLAALPAGQRRVVDFDTEHGSERALAAAGALSVEGAPQRLVALMPVETELEAEAMQAWQKLVHVLTHEIMNSLTPVASLSHTARELLGGVSAALPADIASDLDIALDAIGRRADSLAHFVGGYRVLASVPEARVRPVLVADMFARLAALVGPAWQARGGRASFQAEPATLELMADAGQLEQALVNLLQNAAEATAQAHAPAVLVAARLTRGGRLRIEVSDNGPGVPDAHIADIFTPFFSTKSKGGGIGLAMVRQLVHRNGGALRYAKSIGPGARFVITF